MVRWLDPLTYRQGTGARQSTPKKAAAPRLEQRAWLVRPLGPSDAAQPGTELDISARADVRVGHRCLVLDGTSVVAAGVVLGETAGGQRTQAVRRLLVTHRLDRPFQVTRALGRVRAAPATPADWAAVRDARISGWDFVMLASEALDSSDRELSAKTLEKHAEEFLLRVFDGVDGLHAERQVRLLGTEDPDVLRPRPLQADIVVTWSDDSGAHVLVVEGEWTQPGGAQSAAQAYEYARHFQDRNNDNALAGFAGFPFHRATIHAVVVANRCPGKCLTAEALGVRRFTYAQFVTLIGRNKLGQLPAIAT